MQLAGIWWTAEAIVVHLGIEHPFGLTRCGIYCCHLGVRGAGVERGADHQRRGVARVGPIRGLPSLMAWSGDFTRQTTRRSLALVRLIRSSGESRLLHRCPVRRPFTAQQGSSGIGQCDQTSWCSVPDCCVRPETGHQTGRRQEISPPHGNSSQLLSTKQSLPARVGATTDYLIPGGFSNATSGPTRDLRNGEPRNSVHHPCQSASMRRRLLVGLSTL